MRGAFHTKQSRPLSATYFEHRAVRKGQKGKTGRREGEGGRGCYAQNTEHTCVSDL